MDKDRRRASLERETGGITLLQLAALGLAYIGLSMGVWQLADPSVSGAPWWPAAGLTLGVMLRVNPSHWPAILVTILVADFTADQFQGTDPGTSLAWAASNTIEPLLGAIALRWVFQGRLPNLETPSNVGKFFLTVALAGAPVASLIGATASSITFGQDFFETWRTWYVGDVLGILVVTPIVLYSHQLRTVFDTRLALLTLATAGLSLAVFVDSAISDEPRRYLIMPLLVFAAILYGAPGAALTGITTATIANLASALENGPFAFEESNPNALVELQLFTAVELLSVYLVASLRSQVVVAHAEVHQLTEQQKRDPLTGTGSRMLLDQALQEAVAEPVVGSKPARVAVLFLDINDFKPINDSYGHAIGDEILKVVAQRVEGTVRATDTVARIGGDEFAVVCPDISAESAFALIERLEKSLSEPIAADGHEIRATVSIGCSFSQGQNDDPDRLLRLADIDMYRTKPSRDQPRQSPPEPLAP